MNKICQVHGYHYPKDIRVVTHHIQPIGMGGQSVPENEVDTCDTGHYNIHRLLGQLIKNVGKFDTRWHNGTRNERTLAQKGYDMWIAAGKPGKPVFEDHYAG